MKQFLQLTTALVIMLNCSSAFTQTTRIITGKVIDDKGIPVPYLTIQVKGTTYGTFSDTAGKFTLAVDSTAKILVLKYPAMKTQEVPISDNMLITMKTDVLGLSEVVVTAIGIPTERRALGYSTQVVKSDQLNNTGTSNTFEELDGKVAGLQIINSAGDPGAGTYINLRGPNGLTTDNSPLIVVDGIPIDNSINVFDPQLGFSGGFTSAGASGALYGGAQPTNRALDINPNDIESITVLKGPAASALYGIAAANGALIITTKKGSGGQGEGLGIDFNTSESWETYNKLPQMQQTYAQGNWTDLNQEVPGSAIYQGPTTGNPFSWGPPISTLAYSGIPTPYYQYGELVPAAPGLKPAMAYNAYDFFQTGVTANNNISCSGGNDRSGFRIALGNLDQTGIIPNSKYVKSNLTLSGQSALSKKWSVGGSVTYINSVNDKVQQGSNASGVMLGLLRTPPSFDNSNGYSNASKVPAAYILPNDSQRTFTGIGGYDNPYWTVNENPITSNVNRAMGSANVAYHVLDWIILKWNFGGDFYIQDDKNAQAAYSSENFPLGGIYSIDYWNAQFNSDVTASIQKKLTKDLDLDAVVGQNYFTDNSTTRGEQGIGLGLPYFLQMSNASSYIATEMEGLYHRSAWYAQAILNYKNMLFLTLTGRDETSSTLPVNDDVFFYPSADLGWVFTQTLGMENNNILPYGKLRLSDAQVGSDAPEFALQNYYTPAAVTDGFTSGVSFPFNGIPGYQYATPTLILGDPNLKPQNTTSYEIGIDLAFFQNRISLSSTYYYEKTTNEIFSIPISQASGWGYEEGNLGEVTNKGGEITINTTPVKTKSGFQWDIGLNWNRNVNEVVQLAPGINSLYVGGFNQYDLPGQPADEIYGTDFIRVPGTQFDPSNRYNNLVLSDVPGPGYGLPIVGTTEQPLASAQPSWIGGLTTALSYKIEKLGKFTLAGVMSVREGGYMWDGTYGAMEYYGTAAVTSNRGEPYQVASGAQWGHLNAYNQIVHNNSSGAEVSGTGGAVTQSQDPAIYSEYYYQNIDNAFTGPISSDIFSASYIKFKQISLTWEFPKRWLRRIKFTRFSLTLFSNNPLLWTKYPGVDPETNLGGPSNAQGVDYFNNPNTRDYGVRLNVGI